MQMILLAAMLRSEVFTDVCLAVYVTQIKNMCCIGDVYLQLEGVWWFKNNNHKSPLPFGSDGHARDNHVLAKKWLSCTWYGNLNHKLIAQTDIYLAEV